MFLCTPFVALPTYRVFVFFVFLGNTHQCRQGERRVSGRGMNKTKHTSEERYMYTTYIQYITKYIIAHFDHLRTRGGEIRSGVPSVYILTHLVHIHTRGGEIRSGGHREAEHSGEDTVAHRHTHRERERKRENVYTHTHTHTHSHTHTHTHTYIQTYVYTYIHAYIHPCIHTYIHISPRPYPTYWLVVHIGTWGLGFRV